MTSDKAWEIYNSLMNDLRESIASKAKGLMPLVDATYLFEQNGEESFPLWQDKTIQIIGLKLEENNILILTIEGEFSDEEKEYELQSNVFTFEDLVNILQNIE